MIHIGQNCHATRSGIQIFIQRNGYFTLLHQNGIHKVQLSIPQLDPENTGFVFTLALSRYMEQKADLHGRNFARARAKYNYDFEKNTYQTIFLENTPQVHPRISL